MKNLKLLVLVFAQSTLLIGCGNGTQFETSGIKTKSSLSLDFDNALGSEVVVDDDVDDGEIHVEEVVMVEKASCGKSYQEHKVLVCHHPSGNIENRHEICIAEAALKAHIDKHGSENDKDYLGECL